MVLSISIIMTQKNIQDIYPLSPMQQGMLFHSLLEPESGAYIIQFSCKLAGKLDVNAFTQAWQKLVDRHSNLRTVFVWQKLKQPMQVVAKTVKIDLLQQDWQDISEIEKSEKSANFLQEQINTPFNLNKVPLMRLHLIRMQPKTYQFIWTYHHLILDGWSMAIVIKELLTLYQSFAMGHDICLEPTADYKNYIAWLKQQNHNKAFEFWQKKLQGLNTPTFLGFVSNSNKQKTVTNQYFEQKFKLSAETTYKLQFLTREYKLTLNTIIQGAWAILLHRYSGSQDIVFGATSSGRPTNLTNAQSMVGLLINTLPVRVKLNLQHWLIDYFKSLQTEQLKRQEYEYYSLIDIHRASELPQDIPLFQTIVIFENYPVNSSIKQSWDNLDIRNIETSEQTNYPLTLYAAVDSEISLKLLYDTKLFNPTLARSILDHLKTLLEAIASNPQQQLYNLNILTPLEQQKLLVDINKTAKPYPQDACFPQLWLNQVAKTPNAVAAIFKDQTITYQELNDKSDCVTNHLQQLEVKPETLIGVCLERSMEMLVALLGILKAGAAYVPLDPNHPQARLDYVVEDSKIQILLTQTKHLDKFPQSNLEIINLDSPNPPPFGKGGLRGDHFSTDTQNLAYVIYTSGSTGKPKGVQINHRSLVNFLFSMRDSIKISSDDSLLSVTTIAFDIAALELYLPLLVGAKVVIAPSEIVADNKALAHSIQEHNITMMQATPATWRMLIESNWSGSKQLKILSGGEALETSLANQLITKGKEVWNLYGPTETTIWSSVYKYEGQSSNNILPIGKPIANTQLYILDAQLNLVPPGIPGELYIAGAGLARSYWNRGNLTAEKFIPNPLGRFYDTSLLQYGRLYKTGDRVMYNIDGNLEYLGRIDNQVKMRGFRIELGEIETVLSHHPEVKTAVVIATGEKEEKKLVAYIISQSNQQIDNLRSFLQEQLPSYMIPGNYIFLEKFPLTPNGKIDRSALPKLDTNRPILETPYIVPRNSLESAIAEIWQEVLQLDKVGITDNFFDLGGNSLLMIRVHSKLEADYQLSLIDMFRYPTIVSLAEYLSQIKTNNSPSKPEPELETKITAGKNRLRKKLQKTIVHRGSSSK